VRDALNDFQHSGPLQRKTIGLSLAKVFSALKSSFLPSKSISFRLFSTYDASTAPRMCSLSYSFAERVSTIATPCLPSSATCSALTRVTPLIDSGVAMPSEAT
jgi:hypothetical protein